jgi:hypothetical protein
MSGPARLPIAAGASARGIVPTTFEECQRFGALLAASGMVPKEFAGKPEACAVAVMQGLEIGLSPMAALQSIAVINGRPTLWGDGALAVVRASGLLEWLTEHTDGDTAWCEAKRRGQEQTIKRSFSDADAKAAGLLGKVGPWTQYRPRMRQMRARAWVLRDGFADALKGMGIAEEVNDIPPMRDVTPKSSALAKRDGTDVVFGNIRAAIAKCRSPADLHVIIEDQRETIDALPNRWRELLEDEILITRERFAAPQNDPHLADASDFLDALRAARADCESIQELQELRLSRAELIARLSPADQDIAAAILSEGE